MEFMYKIAEMQCISPHALFLGVWINELASVQIESWLFWMKQCDLLAPRQYIVSNLFTSDKGVEEIGPTCLREEIAVTSVVRWIVGICGNLTTSR